MRQAKYQYTIICTLVAIFLTACNNGSHDDEFAIPAGSGALIVELQSERPDITIDDVHLFVFNSNEHLAQHHYFGEPKELASQYFNFPAGQYTVIAVMNTGTDFFKDEDSTLSDFNQWLHSTAPNHLNMLTGMVQTELRKNEIKRVMITLHHGMGGITLSTLRLLLELPSPNLPDYSGTRAARADVGYSVRCVVEVYRKGTEELLHRRTALPTPLAAGRHSLELSLYKGDYDLRLWADYVPQGITGDYHYSTADLKFVTFNPDRIYTACTDSRDASYATLSIALTKDAQEETIILQRPLAKYRIIATDVNEFIKAVGSKFPGERKFGIRFSYGFYFPVAFDVWQGKPSRSEMGISFAGTLIISDDNNSEIELGSDYIFANGTNSYIPLTIEIISIKSGELIGRYPALNVPYQRAHLTTIRGRFLTALFGSGGIGIDPGYDGDIDIDLDNF